MMEGSAEDILTTASLKALRGKVNLIFTSPPFPLNKKKKYGNHTGEDYIAWLQAFAPTFRDLLAKDGSVVVELGNAWEPGHPVMSTLAIRALLGFQEAGGFHLCQEVIWYNPARLPSPAQWVTIDRVRLKDSFTRFWWLSPSERPKADNRRVLKEYSPHMKRLLARKSFNDGPRPSEHRISTGAFLKDNGGSISPNLLSIANTRSNDAYQRYCRSMSIRPHPARMPPELAEFFIRFLTEEGDLVLDPFAGSNTTGAAAEGLGRYWLSVEPVTGYVESSRGRFENAGQPA